MQSHPAFNKVKFIMSGINKEVTSHVKKQENKTHSENVNQPTENNPELTQMLKLENKDIKGTMTIFHSYKKLSRYMEDILKYANLTSRDGLLQSMIRNKLDEINDILNIA